MTQDRRNPARTPFSAWFLGAALIPLLGAGAARAQTVTDNLGVQIVIQGGCAIQNVAEVDFGTVSLLAADLEGEGEFHVHCTDGHPYTIALNGGAGASVAARRMALGADTISYQLYSDAGRSTVWGETGGDRVSGTGVGTPVPYTVYGLVPAQTTPPAGLYADAVTISVDY